MFGYKIKKHTSDLSKTSRNLKFDDPQPDGMHELCTGRSFCYAYRRKQSISEFIFLCNFFFFFRGGRGGGNFEKWPLFGGGKTPVTHSRPGTRRVNRGVFDQPCRLTNEFLFSGEREFPVSREENTGIPAVVTGKLMKTLFRRLFALSATATLFKHNVM